MNQHLKADLSNKLNGALRNCAKESNQLNLRSSHLTKFYENALKSLSKWISADDLKEIIYHQTIELLKSDNLFKRHSDEKIDKVINEEIILELTSRIIEKLEELPQSYLFEFPVPSLLGFSSVVELDASVRLIPGKELDLNNFKLKDRAPKISIAACGYAKSSQHNTATRNALAKLKAVCIIGNLFGLFTIRPGGNPMAFEFGAIKTKSIFSVKILEPKTNLESLGEIDLGIGLSNYLNNIFLGFSIDCEEYSEDLLKIKTAIELMSNPKSEVNSRSIRRALEWSFDAAIDEDTTTSFIKTCIGLEAVLAEQSQGVGITEQLADRCAFILGKTAEDRKKTRDEMKEIYQLRSKIVHGVSSGLTHKEAEIAKQANMYLRRILHTEISSLVDWWRSNQKREKLSS
ncbi:HEPN domain-containing protein [Achromobacter dolens]|uniref:HEPN domain-containing protein n=1 Tax=Achromobacter dolens TaxID=1287738 RepID=UPI0013C2ED22|nr:HEPN domain-containing protein [Achromobacter dolens]